MGNSLLRKITFTSFLVILSFLMLIVFLIRFEPSQQYVARYLTSYIADKVGLGLEFARIKWQPLSGFSIENLVVSKNGIQVFSARELELSYSLSWKKPFLIPGKVTINRPLVVGELDESGGIINFPDIATRNDAGDKQFFMNIPTPTVEIKDGRIVAVKNGYIVASLKNVSAMVKMFSGSTKDGASILKIVVQEGSFFMERPLLEALRWNGIIELSKWGISLKQFAVFSNHWGIITGTGFWEMRKSQGRFNVSVENLTLQTIPALPVGFRNFSGSTSGNAELTVESFSVKVDYSVSDSRIGRTKGTVLVYLDPGEKIRISNRSFLDIESFPQVEFGAQFKLQGMLRGEMEIDSSGNVLTSYGDIYLDSLKFADVKKDEKALIEKGIIRWRFGGGKLDLEKIDIAGPYGKFTGRFSLKWDGELEALLEWNMTKGRGFLDDGIDNWPRLINHLTRNGLETRSEILSKFFSTPFSESSGIIGLFCDRAFCYDVNSVRVSGRATFSSSKNFFSIEGYRAEGFREVNLRFQGRFENLSEWKGFLGLDSDIDGRFRVEGILSGSSGRLQFSMKSSLENGVFEKLLLKRLSFESNGWVMSCDSGKGERERRCQNLELGDMVRRVDQKSKLTFRGLRRSGEGGLLDGEILVNQSKTIASITGVFKGYNGMPSGNLNLSVDNLGNSPSFSVTRSVVNVPSIGNLVINLKGTFPGSGVIKIDRFRVEQGKQSATGTFIIDGYRSLEGKIAGENIVILEKLFETRGMKLLGGCTNGEIIIGGSVENPVLKASFETRAGELSWKEGRADTSLRWDKIRWFFNFYRERLQSSILLESQKSRFPLEAEVTLPVRFSLKPLDFKIYKDRELSAVISAENLALSHVIPLFLDVKRAGGFLNANIRFYGTLSNLKSRGEVTIENGEIEVDRVYVFSDIEGVLKFEPEGVRIAGVKAKALGGEAFIEGTVPYSDWKQLKVTGRVDKVTVPRFYGITGKGSGSAILTIRQEHPLVEGAFRVEEASMNLDLLRDTLKKSIDVVTDYVGDRSSNRDKREAIDFALRLLIDLSEAKAKVVGLGLYDEVSGKIWLTKSIGEKLKLEGKIEHRKGWYEFNEAKIEISEGYALFKGDPDPDLFLVATKRLKDVEITVNVLGKGSEPEVIMSSNPPLDKIDMVSYLLFNRPATSLTGREGLALQTQVAAFLGSQASRILKKSLGDTPFTPDVIQMRESDSGQSSVIEIGKYLTPDFYVTYEKDLRSSSGDNVKIEYRLNRHFSVQTQLGGQNQSGIDLFWRYDFGR